jgi:hypothetical protein
MIKAVKYLLAGFVFGGVVLALLPDTNASDLTQPTLVIKANGVQDRLTIMPGTDVQISWASSNVSSCSLNNNSWTGLAGEGYSTGPVYNSLTIDGTCSDASGQVVATSKVDIAIDNPRPATAALPVVPTLTMTIDENGSDVIDLPVPNNGVRITWQSDHALSCNINTWTPLSGSGWATGPLTQSVTIEGSCIGYYNQIVTDSVKINVISAPRIDFSGYPSNVSYMSPVTLSWRSTNATSCAAVSGEGFSTAGSRTSTLGSDVSTPLTNNTQNTFTISCAGPGGNATASWAPVVAMPLAPTASITVSPNKLMYGTAPQVLVSWNSTNAVSCKANTDSGQVSWQTGGATSGSVWVSPPDPSKNFERKEPTEFSVNCSNAVGMNTYAYTNLQWQASTSTRPTVTCNGPNPGELVVGLPVSFTATTSGGTGSSVTWTGGATGTGNTLNTTFNTPDIYTVTANYEGASSSCGPFGVMPMLQCVVMTPGNIYINTEVVVSIYGSSTVRNWTAPGGSPASGNDIYFATQYATPGVKTISFAHNSQTPVEYCQVNVLTPPTTFRSIYGPRTVSAFKSWLIPNW